MDVLIVGAGPAGLMLAGDLAAAGVTCAVLERREGESNLTRAFAVHARTLEQLDARGVADELNRTGIRLGRLRFLGGARLDLTRLPSRFNHVLITPQYETERVLGERARALGAEIRTGIEVIGLRQDPAGVDVAVRHRDGTTRTERAAYVVGADGVRSTVRRALGLPFPGRSAVRSVMLADVRLSDPPSDVLTANAVGDAFAFLVPFGDGWYRVIAWNRRHQVPDDAPLDLEEIREVVRRALGTDHGMHDPRWMSRFHSDERQVPRYQVGRVFLVGDAAHVHSPAGGMGMNTSIQDSANLGWKLAATLGGHAPEGLLETYHTERHPVGRQVLRTSGTLLRAVLTAPRVLRAARNLGARTVTRLRPVTRRVTGAISGLDIAYPARDGAHRLAGRRAPDVPLGDGRRLYEALRTRRFVLVMPEGAAVPDSVPAGWADRVECAMLSGPSRSTVLVRPDAYIAWATDEPHPQARADAIEGALNAWCGAPAQTTTPQPATGR
ncbi:FAD-dependent monooxygenase [Actinomadura scrupuli]|uniref:FAD-dependent monooxygenase n=1 Tax=Actinomadura scrupuli TaxID=559629 RepID=UPI003D957173